jgi:hypothetical protein
MEMQSKNIAEKLAFFAFWLGGMLLLLVTGILGYPQIVIAEFAGVMVSGYFVLTFLRKHASTQLKQTRLGQR